MKIFISVDIEGISGISSREQIFPDGRYYESARKIMTKEVNQVINATFENGAKDVVVNDSHFNKDNILIEELDSRVMLISGKYRPLNMLQGIDESFDAVFLIGYHARAGTPEAFYDHTNIFHINNLKINGKSMGELGINGRIAGYFGVPVVLVSGDQKTIFCANEELDNPVGVIVKESISRTAVKIFPPSFVTKLIREGVKEAVEKIKSFKPVRERKPVNLEVSFNFSNMAEICLLIPGVFRKDARTVLYKANDFMEAYKVYRLMIELASKLE